MQLSTPADDRGGTGKEAAAGPGPDRRDGVPIAALDLGTHSCHLAIAAPEARGFRILERVSRTVRLGEGLHETGSLSAAAMDRAIAALAACAARLAARRAVHVRCVATEAVRIAGNRDAFVKRARAETGLALETIDPREEIGLAAAACAPHMDPAWKNALVLDIGAGSVELAWARLRPGGPGLAGWTSLPCGVARLRDRFGDPGSGGERYRAAVRSVAALLAPFERQFGIRRAIADGAAGMTGTGGAVTTLAAVAMGLGRFDFARVDGSRLDFAAIRRLRRELASRSVAGRAAHPCIGPDRAELVVPALAVLEAIGSVWPADGLRASARGVHDGILHEISRSLAADAGEIPAADRRPGRAA